MIDKEARKRMADEIMKAAGTSDWQRNFIEDGAHPGPHETSLHRGLRRQLRHYRAEVMSSLAQFVALVVVGCVVSVAQADRAFQAIHVFMFVLFGALLLLTGARLIFNEHVVSKIKAQISEIDEEESW